MKKNNTLSIISGKDVIEDTLKHLGIIHDYPSVDQDIVANNIRKSSMIMNQGELRKKINEIFLQSDLPNSAFEFLSFYYNPDTNKSMEYLENIKSLLKDLANQRISTNDQAIAQDLLNKFDIIVKEEKEAAEEIRKEIEKACKMHGSLTMEYELINKKLKLINSYSEDVIGYRKNFYGLHHQLTVSTPDWINSKFCRYIGIYNMYLNRISEKTKLINKENFYKDLIIRHAPEEIIYDVDIYLQKLLNEPKLVKKLKERSIKFNIFFSYNGEELTISITDSKISLSEEKNETQFEDLIQWDSVNLAQGYDKQTFKVILKKLSEDAFENKERQVAHGILKKHDSIFEQILTVKPFQIESIHTNKEYKFSDVYHLYGMSSVKERFTKAKTFRSEVNKYINTLKCVSKNIKNLETYAQQHNLPLTLPTITVDNIVSFDNIYPIHLIGRNTINGKAITAKDLEPIKNLPVLQGNIIGITGQNAGGKTVCHETIAYTLYLAQSGLPIFGKNFVFSPKELIAALYLERGEGSTMQLQIRNTKKILEAIETVSPVNALIFLDELGTGTEPDQAITYGKQVLMAIHKRGISCLFTTQLSQIAQFAEESLSAKNYNLTSNHLIVPGIGKPNIKLLLQKEGLDKYLEQTP